jgi:hypothetical protein
MSEVGKARGIYGIVRNVVRKRKGPHQKPKPTWEDINTRGHMHTHTHYISVYSENLLRCICKSSRYQTY